jgi:hypothetical protein
MLLHCHFFDTDNMSDPRYEWLVQRNRLDCAALMQARLQARRPATPAPPSRAVAATISLVKADDDIVAPVHAEHQFDQAISAWVDVSTPAHHRKAAAVTGRASGARTVEIARAPRQGPPSGKSAMIASKYDPSGLKTSSRSTAEKRGPALTTYDEMWPDLAAAFS